jgi:hypothetical protein
MFTGSEKVDIYESELSQGCRGAGLQIMSEQLQLIV